MQPESVSIWLNERAKPAEHRWRGVEPMDREEM